MGVFIPVDVTDFLSRSGHLSVTAQIVEKHKTAVEVNTFKDVIGN